MLGSRILGVVLASVLLVGCSSVQTMNGPVPQGSFTAAAPYGIHVNASNPQLQQLLGEYVNMYFGQALRITEGSDARGLIDVTYTTDADGNAFAKWQNSTLLMVIRGPAHERLWMGEYDYKGGMEMSGFGVNSPAEAAKLTVQRLAKKFQADHH